MTHEVTGSRETARGSTQVVKRQGPLARNQPNMTAAATNPVPSTASQARRLWIFLLVYPLHIAEEIAGVKVFRSFNLSLKEFFILSVAGCLLMVFGILMAQRFRFPQLLEIFFSTVFVLNGLSHIANCAVIRGYHAGVITGTLIMIPLGLASLIRLRNSMRRRRYVTGLALGLLTQVIISLLAS